MIYDNVKRIAELRNKTICQIEREENIGNGTIGAWAKGSKPMVETVIKVAKNLDCPVDELLKE